MDKNIDFSDIDNFAKLIACWNGDEKFRICSLEVGGTILNFFRSRDTLAKIFVIREKCGIKEYVIFKSTFDGKMYTFHQISGSENSEISFLKLEFDPGFPREKVIEEMFKAIFSWFLLEANHIEMVREDLAAYVY